MLRAEEQREAALEARRKFNIHPSYLERIERCIETASLKGELSCYITTANVDEWAVRSMQKYLDGLGYGCVKIQHSILGPALEVTW